MLTWTPKAVKRAMLAAMPAKFSSPGYRSRAFAANSVDGNPSLLETFHHGVHGARLGVKRFITAIIVEEERLPIGRARQRKTCSMYAVDLPAISMPGLVVPDGRAQMSALVDGFVDRVQA
jgi:hypothetical protein